MTASQIKQIRLDADMTQSEFAKALGLSSYTTVCDLETGKHKPSRSTRRELEKFAKKQARKVTA